MGRKALYEKVRKDLWVLKSQDEELRRIAKVIGKSQTEAITEAIAYWLSAQRKMGL